MEQKLERCIYLWERYNYKYVYNYINDIINIRIQQRKESFPLDNLPKCPTCGSENIEKISNTSKATGGLFFGLFSNDVRKTFHCKNCGYKW